MGGHSALDVGQVTMNASDDTNMLGGSNKLDISVIDTDGGHCFLIVGKKLLGRRRKNHKFCFFRSKSDMVSFAVVEGELKQMVEQHNVG